MSRFINKRLSARFIVVTVFFLAPLLWSEAFAANSSGLSKARWAVTIKGLMTGQIGTGKDGACSGGNGYANHCESGGCICYTGTGTASGSPGSGSFSLYLTYDTNDNLTSNDYFAHCAPVYGEIDIQGSRDDEVIAFFGGNCQNATQPPSPGFNQGGCYLANSNVYAAGFGQCSGPYSSQSAAYQFTFTIRGTAVRK